MNLDYTDEQRALKEELAKFLQQRCDSAAVRRVLTGAEPEFDRGLWRELADLGWLSAAIAAEHGGQGLEHVVLCAIAEEFGKALAPVPVSSSLFMATEAIATFGSDDQQREWLPRLGKGSAIGTMAWWEGAGCLRPSLAVRVSDGRLFGIKQPVADGNIADVAIVVAMRDGHAEPGLFVVDLAADGVRRERLLSLDESRPAARLIFEGARVEPLGTASGWSAVDAILDRAAILTAFEQVGGADRALSLAVAYAQQRHAFGRPIGGFQAIKHKLADVYIQLELARSNAYYAAWALTTGSEQLPLAAAIARVSATRAFELAARECLHVHGGFGMTWESDCHLYYRRSRHLATGLGSVGDWRDRLIDLLERRPGEVSA